MKIAFVCGCERDIRKAAKLNEALVDSMSTQVVYLGADALGEEEVAKPFESQGEAIELFEIGLSLASVPERFGLLIADIGQIFGRSRPDAIAILGDTNIALAAALVGTRLHIPIVALESGRRAFQFARLGEDTRRVIAQLATLHFVDSPFQAYLLAAEGISADRIHVVGSLQGEVLRALEEPAQAVQLRASTSGQQIKTKNGKTTVLVALEYIERLDDPVVLATLLGLPEDFDTYQFVWYLHPDLKAAMEAQKLAAESVDDTQSPGGNGSGDGRGALQTVEVEAYTEQIALIQQADVVLTDSFSWEEDALLLGKPVLALRSSTLFWSQVVNGQGMLLPGERSTLHRALEQVILSNLPLAEDGGDQQLDEETPSGRIVEILQDWLRVLSKLDRKETYYDVLPEQVQQWHQPN